MPPGGTPRACPRAGAVTYDAAMRTPVILFGAFDRHDFGDLLFRHSMPAELDPAEMAQVLHVALAVAPDRLQHQARRLARLHRAGFTALCAGSIRGQGRDRLTRAPCVEEPQCAPPGSGA